MSTLSDLESWKLFFKVVSLGSVTKVAEEIGVEPSSVSRKINKLESELGVELFVRSGKKLVLSAAGSVAYSRMRRIVFDASTLFNDLSKIHAGEGKKISIASPIGIGEIILPMCLSQYQMIEPDIAFSLRTLSYVELFSAEALSGYDILFTVVPVNVGSHDCRLIGGCSHFLAATPEYLASNPPIETPRDLAKHRLFSFYSRNRERSVELRKNNEHFTFNLHASLRVNHPGAIKTAVMTSTGIGLYCPTYFYLDELHKNEVSSVLADWKMPIQQIYCSHKYTHQPEILNFCNWIADYFPNIRGIIPPDHEGYWLGDFGDFYNL